MVFGKKKNLSNPLVILGMHRSGTSVVAGICNILGVDMGDDLFPAREDNPKGFWEHNKLLDLNEPIFELFGMSSQGVKLFPEDWQLTGNVQDIKAKLIEVLEEDFKGKNLWGIKDPRMGRLMPLYIDIFEKLKITPKFIIPFRHPLQVANSLAKRDGISVEHGLLMWVLYNLDIEFYTRSFKRSFVRFEDIFTKTEEVFINASKQMELNWPNIYDSRKSEINKFVEPDLWRNKADMDAMPGFPSRQIFDLFIKLSEEPKNPEISDNLDNIRHDVEMIIRPFIE